MNDRGAFDIRMVTVIVALLLAIIIGVMIYFSILGNVSDFSSTTRDTFTGYSHGNNASAWSVTTSLVPIGTTGMNVTCWSSSAGTLSYPAFTLNFKTISVAAGAASNFTQVNVSYTSEIGNNANNVVTPIAQSVFSLLPIVALVVVASVILFVILGFGGGGRKT